MSERSAAPRGSEGWYSVPGARTLHFFEEFMEPTQVSACGRWTVEESDGAPEPDERTRPRCDHCQELRRYARATTRREFLAARDREPRRWSGRAYPTRRAR